MYEVFFYSMAVLTVSLVFVCQWYFAKGNLKLAYPLTILVTLCYIIMDIGMALYDPVLMGVLIFGFANAWTLYMCFKGMLRLREEEKRKRADDNE